MPLQIVRNDITKMKVDAIVNAANESLLGGGGVDGCESVAFSLISSGIFGYPKDQALKVAIDTIRRFLLENEMMVYIVIFDCKAYQISGKLFADIAAYIDDRYVDEHTDSRSERLRRMNAFRMEEPMPCESSVCDEEAIEQLIPPVSATVAPKKAATLDDTGTD